jgi:N-acetylglucosamine kinase
MQYVIGIDAGGTKTVGLLADETGQVVAEERGSGANLQTHGELEVEKVFADVMEALAQGRTNTAVGLGIAGVDRPHDGPSSAGSRRLGHREGARRQRRRHRAVGGSGRRGIVVLAGTGSISYGQDRAGKSRGRGGLPHLADEARMAGTQALRATVRAATDGARRRASCRSSSKPSRCRR